MRGSGGIVYISTQRATISGFVTKAETVEPLANVNVTLIESEDTVQTDAEGKYKLGTSYIGMGTLEFALEGFTTLTLPVDIPEGGTLAQDVQMKPV